MQEAIEILIFAGIIFGNFVTACLAAGLAQQKGFNGVGAFFIGLLFGLLVLIYYVGMPDLKHYQRARELQDWYHNNTMAQLKQIEARLSDSAERSS